MKIKYTLTLFCVIPLVIFMVSCADDSSGTAEYTGPFEASNVSARQCTSSVSPLNCFISVWNTENSGNGASDSKMVKLPLVSQGTYDFYVDWGDGKEVEKITTASAATHTYDAAGEKTIHIAGTIKGWRFFVEHPNFGDAVKLLNVTQWGSLSLGNTDGRQFTFAKNFNPTATDAPDVSETTDLTAAFASASNFNADISDWDVGEVTTMNSMFPNATNFNNNGKPLDWGAKTSKVTDTSFMFWLATNFNQDIRDWDVSQVTDMRSMFNGASSFNNNGKPLDWGDKTSQVETMKGMFLNASVFNQDVSKWNVANVGVHANFAAGSGIENNSEFLPKFKPQ